VKTSGIIVAVICMVIFCGATTQPAAAQDEASPRTVTSLTAWKATNEITFGAAVHEVVSKNPSGAPAGLNLLVDGSQRVLYVNVGPRLDDKVKQALTPGQVIQVVGVVQTFNGQSYLLARELQIGDRKIEVRNQHGFLTYPSASTGPRSIRTESSKIGGAR
jgi:DNA/RNA endonuclease YhcR with UshA esterase domain